MQWRRRGDFAIDGDFAGGGKFIAGSAGRGTRFEDMGGDEGGKHSSRSSFQAYNIVPASTLDSDSSFWTLLEQQCSPSHSLNIGELSQLSGVEDWRGKLAPLSGFRDVIVEGGSAEEWLQIAAW